jgi:hypothetical protein
MKNKKQGANREQAIEIALICANRQRNETFVTVTYVACEIDANLATEELVRAAFYAVFGCATWGENMLEAAALLETGWEIGDKIVWR